MYLHRYKTTGIQDITQITADRVHTAQLELFFSLVEGTQAGWIAHQIKCQFFQRSDRPEPVASSDIPVEHVVIERAQ